MFLILHHFLCRQSSIMAMTNSFKLKWKCLDCTKLNLCKYGEVEIGVNPKSDFNCWAWIEHTYTHTPTTMRWTPPSVNTSCVCAAQGFVSTIYSLGGASGQCIASLWLAISSISPGLPKPSGNPHIARKMWSRFLLFPPSTTSRKICVVLVQAC